MKTLFALITYFLISVLIMLSSDIFTFNKENIIDQKVLELSVPFSVKIDTDLLNSLKPANEQ